MTDLPKSAISPLAIAARLAAAAQRTQPAFAKQLHDQPRLAEILWFLQYISMQPGSLEEFALALIQEFSTQFGPAVVHDESAPLTLEQRTEIWKILSSKAEQELLPFKSWASEAEESDTDWVDSRKGSLVIGVYLPPKTPEEKKRFNAMLLKIPRQQFRDVFLDAAKESLAWHLRTLCLGKSKDSYQERMDWDDSMDLDPLWCKNLAAVLFEAMDLHASRIELQLARTEVVSLVFDRLDYAWQEKVLVKIEGDTRTGKTEAVKAWCGMNPGKSRLVSTPGGKSCSDLFKAIAEAIGLPYGPKTKGTDLKEQLQHIIRHAGLFLVFDEAHFLLPSNFDSNSAPSRLDWVRTQIIDRNLPVAIICTPQAFRHGVEKFQKRTGYNFNQFLGRIMLNVTLPDELSEADFLAVAKIQGHDIPEDLHRDIIGPAMRSEGYLNTVGAICCRARYIARREQHQAVTLADVELAASEVCPAPSAPGRAAAPAAQALAARTRQVSPSAPALAAPARQTSPAPALKSLARSVTPEMETV